MKKLVYFPILLFDNKPGPKAILFEALVLKK